MSEERMKVLNMLAEGKITAEEAARLLEALGDKKAEEPKAEDRPERAFKVKFDSGDLVLAFQEGIYRES